MTPRGRRTTFQERLEIGERAVAGQHDAQIAADLGYSIWTVRKWRRRGAHQGRPGLASQMGRPATGPLGSYPAELRDEIEQVRREHPGWGAPSILDDLAAREYAAGPPWPHRSRVAAFLQARALTRPYERHGGVPPPPSCRPVQPHEEWELDAQGVQVVAGLGRVSVVNIADVVSRLKVQSYPHLSEAGLTWRDYQFVLRCSFVPWGLPAAISLDHDSAFYDNTSPSPYPGHLHLWLVALGVQVLFIRKGRATDHAIIERGHQTMAAQTLQGQPWPDQATLWHGLTLRRAALNERLPSRVWAGAAPLVACPLATHSGREYRLEWEEELLDLTRIDRLLATGRWFRQTNCHGEFWLGLRRYNAGRSAAKCTLEITFDPRTHEFVTQAAGATATRRFAALGLTKTELMGDLARLSLPNYQLMLPFTHQAWREMELANLKAGTTL